MSLNFVSYFLKKVKALIWFLSRKFSTAKLIRRQHIFTMAPGTTLQIKIKIKIYLYYGRGQPGPVVDKDKDKGKGKDKDIYLYYGTGDNQAEPSTKRSVLQKVQKNF